MKLSASITDPPHLSLSLEPDLEAHEEDIPVPSGVYPKVTFSTFQDRIPLQIHSYPLLSAEQMIPTHFQHFRYRSDGIWI